MARQRQWRPAHTGPNQVFLIVCLLVVESEIGQAARCASAVTAAMRAHTAAVTSARWSPCRPGRRVCSAGSAVTRFDRRHQRCAAARLAQVLQQHHAGPERAHRIGQALAHDVEGRAVDGLEHRWGSGARGRCCRWARCPGCRPARRPGRSGCRRAGWWPPRCRCEAGRLTMRAVMASTSSLSHFTSGNSLEICSAISSHITMAWRWALTWSPRSAACAGATAPA